MKNSLILIGFMIFVFGCQTKNDLPISITLDENWTFKSAKDSIWLPAIIHGNVHSDLLENNKIEDPFIGDNEAKQQWISDTNWDYKTTFNIDKETLQKNHIELNFQGLDTYVSVFLNDSLILKSNNAFRQYSVEVKPYLKLVNELHIVFEKTSTSETLEKEKLNYELPEGNRIFTRKAQFQYGWDWGPKLNTSGIWKPIKLIANNDLKIRDVYIHQIKLNDSIAKLNFQIDLAYNKTDCYTFQVFVNDSLTTELKDGFQYSRMSIPFEIKNPKRWWPHNLGDPYLYDIKVVVKDGDNLLDSISVKKGLRTIELITEKDSIGESFYFKVNDVPVYAKGANYIPQNSMQNKVTETHYKKLLDDVVEANMNMLRVWGGGIYENDIFYDLCDEKGILIWQDFMFACAMYPGDTSFLKNVEQEAIDNVKRLRNHASLALWCGNNENSEGWQRWGWQAERSEEEKDEIWGNYLKVFDSILPKTVARLTDTNYWESSPKYGRGNPKYKTEGDAHDWWIWHDAYPFEHLEENVPRFMSEFGFQSFPTYETIKYINQSDSLDITSEAFKTHQKHNRGFQLIRDYMARDFVVPNNPEDYVYVSQLLQAYGITKGIKAHRLAKPYNMGTLYWQLNDCWPAVSWSSIDFIGNWKALHYKAKRVFKDVLITSKLEGEVLKFYAVNDDLNPFKNELSLQIIDFSGTLLWEDSKVIQVSTDSSQLVFTLDLNSLSINKNEVVIVSKLNADTFYDYLVKPKDLKLQHASIKRTIIKTPKGFKIELGSKTLQKDVFLFCNAQGHFSDNYFDLLPNETKSILFESNAETLDDLRIKTFNNLIR